jgi:hypothetical protein
MDHYFVAGTVTRNEKHLVTRLWGDWLVRLPSATAPGRTASLPAEHFAILPGVHHMDLSRSSEVFAKLRQWFDAPVEARLVHAERREPSAAELDALVPASCLMPPAEPMPGRNLKRWGAAVELLSDAVVESATAIQEVQEELTRRPYAVLEQIPPLETPTAIVRGAHMTAMRATYGMIRLVARLAGAAAHESLEQYGRSKGTKTATDAAESERQARSVKR